MQIEKFFEYKAKGSNGDKPRGTKSKITPKTAFIYKQILGRLANFATSLSKDGDDLTEEEIKTWLDQFHGNYFNNALGIVRQYYAFLGLHTIENRTKKVRDNKGQTREEVSEEVYPYLANEGQKTRGTKDDYVERITKLTPEDILKLKSAALNLRDKAIIMVLADCGFRAGELISIRLKDVDFIEKGVLILCPKGKTGARTVLGSNCQADLTAWMESHPFKDRPESPLFCVIRKTSAPKDLTAKPRKKLTGANIGDPISEYILFGIIRSVAKRAGFIRKTKAGGITGDLHPHALRHYAATQAAIAGISIQDMMIRFGWASMDMARRYTHLKETDANANYAEKIGLKKKIEKIKEVNACPKCLRVNLLGVKYCANCGSPMTIETQQQLDVKKEKMYGFSGDVEILKELAHLREELEALKNKDKKT